MKKSNLIFLKSTEIQRNISRVDFAEGLIQQLPADHDGRNTWLLNYGTLALACSEREKKGLKFDKVTQSAYHNAQREDKNIEELLLADSSISELIWKAIVFGFELNRTKENCFEETMKAFKQKLQKETIKQKRYKLILEGSDIISVEREDSVTFQLTDSVRFKDKPNCAVWKIDNFHLSDNGILLARSQNNEIVEDIETIEHEGVDIALRDKALLHQVMGLKPLVTSESYSFHTYDDVYLKKRDIIYGAAPYASGVDRIRKQVLPFKNNYSYNQNRVWFSTEEKAKEYIIKQSATLALREIEEVLNSRMAWEMGADTIESVKGHFKEIVENKLKL